MTNAVFRDNVVVLTGASSGIGEQLAYQLAGQGAKLALAARRLDKLEGVAEACRQRGGQAIPVQTDVTDEQQCRNLIQRTVETYGRIDTLLANAGKAFPRRFAEMKDLNAIREETALNYLGVVYCAYHALPYLRQTRGRIVGINSFGGQIGLPGTIGYSSGKHALRGFLNTLRVELAGTGISVTQLFVGAVTTERLTETMGENALKVPSMTPQRCAAIIIDTAARRKRQLIMTATGKAFFWLSLLVPRLIEPQLNRIAGLYVEN